MWGKIVDSRRDAASAMLARSRLLAPDVGNTYPLVRGGCGAGVGKPWSVPGRRLGLGSGCARDQ